MNIDEVRSKYCDLIGRFRKIYAKRKQNEIKFIFYMKKIFS